VTNTSSKVLVLLFHNPTFHIPTRHFSVKTAALNVPFIQEAKGLTG
jgi:hypothetical protein